MDKPDFWKRISSEPVADCRVFKVRRDICVRNGDGEKSDFFVIENPDWVNIIAKTRDGKIVLVEQFRHGVEEMHLELPGGMVDDGEDPQKAAERELLEETGYSSSKWKLLGKSHPNPAIQNNTLNYYLALDCDITAEPSFDEHESIKTRLVSENEIERLIREGEITHSLNIAAFYYLTLLGGE